MYLDGLRPRFVEQRRHDGPDLPLAELFGQPGKGCIGLIFLGWRGQSAVCRAELGGPILLLTFGYVLRLKRHFLMRKRARLSVLCTRTTTANALNLAQ
jgi:hypothetical protein